MINYYCIHLNFLIYLFYLSIIYLFVYSFIYIISTPLFIHLFIHFLYSGISSFFFIYWEQVFFIFFFGRGGMISIIHSNFTANTHSVEKRYSSFVVKIETYSRINYQLKETEGLKAIAWHGYERMECHSFILYSFFLIEIHNIYHWYKQIQLYKCQ